MDQKTNNNDVIPSISTNPSENATRPEHTDMPAASPTPADIAAPSNESSGALNVVPAVAGEADAAAAVTNEGTITTVPETSPMSPSGASRDASDERTSEQVELAISAAIPTENSSNLNVTGMTSTTEAANNASSPVVTDEANEATHSVATAASPESPSGASSEHTSDNPELWIPDAAPTRNPEKLTSNTITATVSEATSTAGSSSSEEANTVASVASPESTLGASTDVARTLMSDDPALWTPNVAPAGNPATHTNVKSRTARFIPPINSYTWSSTPRHELCKRDRRRRTVTRGPFITRDRDCRRPRPIPQAPVSLDDRDRREPQNRTRRDLRYGCPEPEF